MLLDSARRIFQADDLAVYADAAIAGAPCFVEDPGVLALAVLHHGASSVTTVPAGSAASPAAIPAADCAATRRPHWWQCCSPTRA